LKVKKYLEVHVTRGMLAAKVTKLKKLKEDAKKLDEEYGELEEIYTEVRGESFGKQATHRSINNKAALQVQQ